MSEKEVQKKIIEILINTLHVNPKIIEKNEITEKLTGINYRFDAKDLVYLYIEVIRFFSIQIQAENLEKYPFDSIYNISQLILIESSLDGKGKI